MYNSSTYRRPQASTDAAPERYRTQTQQLKEMFSDWSNEDLQSVLVEVGGDVELAAFRISEGHVSQWGAVQRKKDKKSSTPISHVQSKEHAGSRERGEFRGRGGRGGRGGPGRGGATRGSFARGGHQETNGRKAGPSKNGDATSLQLADEAPAADLTATDVNGVKPVEDAPAAEPVVEVTSTPATWGGDTVANGSTTPAPSATPSQPPHPAAKPIKTPATSKLSWAQIAKPQDKPTAPPAPAPVSAPTPIAAPAPAAPVAQPTAATQASPAPEPVQSEPQPELAAQGWEEPTTVQAPTWDDEPTQQTQTRTVEAAAQEELKEKEEEPASAPPTAPTAQPEIVERVLSALPPQVQPSTAKLDSVQAPAPGKPATPAQHTRPTSAALRHKFKADQAVIMPSGSFTAIEKVGMQFGSLSLGGDDLDGNTQESSADLPNQRAPEPAVVAEIQASSQPVPTPAVQTQAAAPEASSAATSPPVQTPSSTGPSLFQGIPQQAQQQAQISPSAPVTSAAQHQPQSGLQSSLSQPALPAQVSAQPQSSASTSNISSYSHNIPAAPPALPSHQHPQQGAQSQGLLSQQQQQYAQHGLPTHLDQTQATTQSPHAAPAPQQSLGGHSSYFRQQEPPYFHTPTPPVSASQSQEGPYGSFGQLSGQLAHQNQASHLAGFSGGDYQYGENQRNFYESYSGPTGFGNRNMLGHEDIKGLPGAPQQPHGAPGLTPSAAQPSQQLPQSGQSANQAQPGGQGPQQSYPPPLPYYYTPYPQSQYYGSPYNSAYSVPQPFVKYPPVFQGPQGPQSAPSPAAKQAPSAVQPQSPYGQALYGQQHSSSPYGELDYQSHGQGVSGIPSNDYGKQLYGGSGQGMQGFMGLGQTSGPSSGAPLGQRTGGSPEAAYKPYGGNTKDVGAGVGQGGQQQGRGGVQQPQGGFYGAQRFSGAGGAGPQGAQAQQHQPQGQGPQGHLGYPQGSSDGNFYSYQPRQQGYWQ